MPENGKPDKTTENSSKSDNNRASKGGSPLSTFIKLPEPSSLIDQESEGDEFEEFEASVAAVNSTEPQDDDGLTDALWLQSWQDDDAYGAGAVDFAQELKQQQSATENVEVPSKTKKPKGPSEKKPRPKKAPAVLKKSNVVKVKQDSKKNNSKNNKARRNKDSKRKPKPKKAPRNKK